MKQWRTYAALLAIFASGVICGAIGTGWYIESLVRGVISGGPPAVRKVIVGRLESKLKLSGEQRVQITRIVADAQRQMKEVRQAAQPRIRRIVVEAVDKIGATLEPWQQRRWETIRSRVLGSWFLKHGAAEEAPAGTPAPAPPQ